MDTWTHIDPLQARLLQLERVSASGYTTGMKTAVSIPDDIFQEADRLAAELGHSRSQLYSRALREYIACHSPDRVTEALNAVYAEPEDESELEFLEMTSRETFGRSEW